MAVCAHDREAALKEERRQHVLISEVRGSAGARGATSEIEEGRGGEREGAENPGSEGEARYANIKIDLVHFHWHLETLSLCQKLYGSCRRTDVSRQGCTQDLEIYRRIQAVRSMKEVGSTFELGVKVDVAQWQKSS